MSRGTDCPHHERNKNESDRPSLALPASTAVLVVDMVNDFCTDGGAMVLPGSDVLYPPIARLTDTARDLGAHIVWVRDEHEPGDWEFRKRSVHCLRGTWGAQIVDELPQHESDSVRTKRTFSSFYGSDLDAWLMERGITHLIVCGVVTNVCVRSTVHDAFFRGFEVAVATDACAGTSDREHEAAIYDMDTHFAHADSVDELLAGAATSSRAQPIAGSHDG